MPADPSPDPPTELTRRRAAAVLLVMCAGMFLVLLDVTVVNVAVPSIASGLDAGTAGVQGVVDAYSVTLASLVLAAGPLGDRIGHRLLVLAGLAIFGAASAGAGLAPTIATLVLARAVQGCGAGLLLPSSLALIAEAFPVRPARARALGIWAGVSGLALPAGPLLGGVLVSAWGWQAVFWINPPVVTLSLVAVVALTSRSSPAQAEFDPPGAGLATAALGALVFAVIAAGRGSLGGALPAAGVAVVAGGAFAWRERRARAPLIPLEVLSEPGFVAANAAALVMNLTANGLLFVLTRYLQGVLRQDPLTAGASVLPLFVPLAVLSPLVGRVVARTGPRRPLLVGAALAGAGQACLLGATPTGGYAALLPALAGVGLGLAVFTTPVVAAAISAVPDDRSGVATGVNNAVRQAGTALGVALFGAVAGAPENTTRFVGALHVLGAGSALLWLGVIGLIVVGLRR